MVERTKLLEILNNKQPINEILIDFFCVEHNHKPEEINQLFEILNMTGAATNFAQCVIRYYLNKLNVFSVQKKNPDYKKNTIFGVPLNSEYITLYYY